MTIKIISAAICILILSNCSRKDTGPIISYSGRVVDLGSITFKQEYAGKIMIKNKGNETLTLLGATADCSCTVPEDIKNMKIEPNDSGLVKFKLTPARDGYMQQNIYLDNNSLNETRVLFLVRANVKLVD